MKLIHWLLDLLYPPKCTLCQRLLKKQETDFCAQCRRDTDRYVSGKENISFVASSVVLWYYEEKVRDSLLRYKFHRCRHYASSYARLLAMRLLEDPVRYDLITWVPTGAARRRRRGYDQCQLLAQALAREVNIPAVSTLKKIRNNKVQSRLPDAAARKANVLGVYRSVHPERFRGKRILLIDDIITTGSTLSECARVLTTDGAAAILGAAVAASSHSHNSR